MNKKFITAFILFVSFLISCSMGGGGGKYYPPQVAINELGVTKEEIQEAKIYVKTKILVDDQTELEKTYIPVNKYHYYRAFNFLGKQYRVGIPLYPWVSIIDSTNSVVLKLELPRYATSAAAIELVGKNGTRYLAVFVGQQSTSHSSTLFIISKDWRVLYKEHLLGAEWISKETSEYGDNLLLSAETQWRQNERWVSIGGPWRYKIFKP